MSTPDYSRTKYVTKEQVERLWELLKKSADAPTLFLDEFHTISLSTLPADQFDAALQWLYRRINRCTACDGKGTWMEDDLGGEYDYDSRRPLQIQVQCTECGGKGVL